MDTVDRRYRPLRLLGEGAAGAVWLARDERRDIEIALKILRPKHATTLDMIARFVREAELAERMLSPHIVRVLARGTTADGAPYIAYEHLDGQDLAARLGPDGRLSLEDARAVVVHTCRALARAHALGVLHRDIKPENLFVTKSDGRTFIKVLDFGVAELMASAARQGPLVGTLEYIAPEIILRERVPSAQSDLFALGVVAYQCLTGQVPFPASTVGQLVLTYTTGTKSKPLHELDPSLPQDLDAWFGRVLARDPDARFESAREMAAAFERAVAAADVTSTGEHPRMASNVRRSPWSRYALVSPRGDPAARRKKK